MTQKLKKLMRPNRTIGMTTTEDSGGKLSLQARRLYICILLFSQQQQKDATGYFQAPIAEFVLFSGIAKESSDARPNGVISLLEELSATAVRYNVLNGYGERVLCSDNLISSPRYDPNNGNPRILWMLPDDITNLLFNQENNYTPFSFRRIAQLNKLKSSSTFALAEMCMRYENFPNNSAIKSTPWLSTSEWAAICSSKYQNSDKKINWSYLYRDTIKPGLEQVQYQLDYTLRIEGRRKGVVSDSENMRNIDEFRIIIKKIEKLSEYNIFDLTGDLCHNDYDVDVLARITCICKGNESQAKSIYEKYFPEHDFLCRTIDYVLASGNPNVRYLRAALRDRYVDGLSEPQNKALDTQKVSVISSPIQTNMMIGEDVPASPVSITTSDEEKVALTESIDHHLKVFDALAKDEQDNLVAEWLAARPKDNLILLKSKHGIKGLAARRFIGNFMAARTIPSTEVI